MPRFIAIAAMASNRVIGLNGKMPWSLPEDMKFFRETTSGHAVLMGRKTWESLGRPLPNRRNLVLSRTRHSASGAEILHSLSELEDLGLKDPVYVIGGEEIYRLLMPQTSEILLTILDQKADGDTFFPEFEQEFQLAKTPARLSEAAELRHYVRKS